MKYNRAFRTRSNMMRLLKSLVLAASAILTTPPANAAEPGAAKTNTPVPPAALMKHFPSRTHAVVWRNWRAVEPEVIARVLGTSPDTLSAMAQSMGLPPAAPIPPEQKTKGYFWMTLCRRNWHLLPMDQLATLAGTSPDALMNFLRVEEMANWIILGGFKPDCEPVRYAPPTEDIRRRASRIRDIVEESFDSELSRPDEPRFAFVQRLSRPKTGAATHRQPEISRFSPRFICSYLKIYGDPLMDPQIDMYPEGLLQRLAEVGVDGIWLYGVLRELAPGGQAFPEFGMDHETRQANLRTLVTRARRHGMGVYLYINEPRAMTADFFKNRPEMRGVGDGMCTSHPAVRRWMSDALAHLFAHVPDLAGVFTITASENQTNCAWSGRWDLCPRCKSRSGAEILAEVNAAIEEGVHRGSPSAKVIAWDWGWELVKDPLEVIRRLPQSTWLMSVSEWSKPICRGGVNTEVGEYSLSAVGPGPRALRHWELARQRGLKTIAKVQLNTSWELASLPYLPVMDLVAQHCAGLAATRIDGMMLTWSLGGYPSANLEIAHQFSRNPDATIDGVLDAMAREHFGPDGAPHARKAWSSFSRAFQEYPYSGAVLYNSPAQLGPANLLYATRTGWKATMVGFPYDDLPAWCPPYPPEVFAAQFQKVAAGWQIGLSELRLAVEKSTAAQRTTAQEEYDYAQAACLYFRSIANQVRFILARDAIAAAPLSPEARQQKIDTIARIVQDEIAVARSLYSLTKAHSCIGFEAASQYFFLPLDLVEKVVSCRQVLDDLAGK